MFFGAVEIKNPVLSANSVQETISEDPYKNNEIILSEKIFRNEHSTAIIHVMPTYQKSVLVVSNKDLDKIISAFDAEIYRKMEEDNIDFKEAYMEVYSNMREGKYI